MLPIDTNLDLEVTTNDNVMKEPWEFWLSVQNVDFHFNPQPTDNVDILFQTLFSFCKF